MFPSLKTLEVLLNDEDISAEVHVQYLLQIVASRYNSSSFEKIPLVPHSLKFKVPAIFACKRVYTRSLIGTLEMKCVRERVGRKQGM